MNIARLRLRTERLLNDFAIVWGHKWSSQIAGADYDRLVQKWLEITQKLDDEDIKQALQTCRASLEWPPSFREFLCAAFEFYSDEAAYRIASTRKTSDLDELKRNSENWSDANEVLLNARDKARWIFDDRNNKLTPEKERNSWNKIYREEVNLCLNSIANTEVNDG